MSEQQQRAVAGSLNGATNSLPSALAGEGGSRGAIAKREPGEGQRINDTPTPHPPSLGFASARAPPPQGERGSVLVTKPKTKRPAEAGRLHLERERKEA